LYLSAPVPSMPADEGMDSGGQKYLARGTL
jgi:hypothetical protein